MTGQPYMGDGIYVTVVENGASAQQWIPFALFEDEPVFASMIRPEIERLRASAQTASEGES